MQDVPTLALTATLITALIGVALGDWRARTIPNSLNAAIAALAPLWWWALGLSLWPAIAAQLALAACVFAILAGLFAIGAMGGGDVKLLSALALWLPLGAFFDLLMLMAVIGGALTIAMLLRHRWLQAEGRVEVPYGIAIAFAGVWSISQTVS